jgi:hypothetical protein
MANLQRYFERFHETIRTDYDMDETLRDKRDTILNLIAKRLREAGHPGFQKLDQGSYAMRTGDKPIGELEYDIDVGLRFPLQEAYPATTVRQWVFEAIDGHTHTVFEKGPCIRVVYAKGYHVDLVIYDHWEDNLGESTSGLLTAQEDGAQRIPQGC